MIYKKALVIAVTCVALSMFAFAAQATEEALPGKDGAIAVDEKLSSQFHVNIGIGDAFEKLAPTLRRKILEATGAGATGDCSKLKDSVLIVTDSDLVARAYYLSANQQLKFLIDSAAAVLSAGSAASGEKKAAATPTALANALAFLRLFKVDRTVAFTDASLDGTVLVDLVSTPFCENFGRIDAIEGMEKFQGTDVWQKYQILEEQRAKLNAVRADKDNEKAALKSLAEAIDKLINELFSVADKRAVTGMQLAILGERANALIEASSHIVQISVPAQGGITMRDSSAWRSDRLYASGGAMVAWRVFTLDAKTKRLKLKAMGLEKEGGSLKQIPLNHER